jgi:AraC family transcriptional activator of mtrCDE
VAGEPFWRISRQDLDKLMITLEVTFVKLSECALATGAHLTVARTNASTIHYCLRGAGVVRLDDAPPYA